MQQEPLQQAQRLRRQQLHLRVHQAQPQ